MRIDAMIGKRRPVAHFGNQGAHGLSGLYLESKHTSELPLISCAIRNFAVYATHCLSVKEKYASKYIAFAASTIATSATQNSNYSDVPHQSSGGDFLNNQSIHYSIEKASPVGFEPDE
jgi:hypothetical protein